MPDSVPNSPHPVEDDLASARRRVAELEAELQECEELLLQGCEADDLHIQLEQADLLLDECAEARRKLQQRVDELEGGEPAHRCGEYVVRVRDGGSGSSR